MTADQISRPLLLGLFFAGWLAFAGEPAASPGAEGLPPPAPSPAAALFIDLEIAHLRAHAAADRLAEWDVGVHPVPPPRRLARR